MVGTNFKSIWYIHSIVITVCCLYNSNQPLKLVNSQRIVLRDEIKYVNGAKPSCRKRKNINKGMLNVLLFLCRPPSIPTTTTKTTTRVADVIICWTKGYNQPVLLCWTSYSSRTTCKIYESETLSGSSFAFCLNLNKLWPTDKAFCGQPLNKIDR